VSEVRPTGDAEKRAAEAAARGPPTSRPGHGSCVGEGGARCRGRRRSAGACADRRTPGHDWYECFNGTAADAVPENLARWVGPTEAGRGIAVRQPSILDVVHAVKRVLPAHPEVSAWWYTPPQRLRLAGDLPGAAAAALTIEVVVEGAGEAGGAAEVPCASIAKELSEALARVDRIEVHVRIHRGDAEERPLFRIVTPGKRSSSGEAPRPA
jgi:hypothetical protein